MVQYDWMSDVGPRLLVKLGCMEYVQVGSTMMKLQFSDSGSVYGVAFRCFVILFVFFLEKTPLGICCFVVHYFDILIDFNSGNGMHLGMVHGKKTD